MTGPSFLRMFEKCATVFVWYPSTFQFGHCSMYIGDCDRVLTQTCTQYFKKVDEYEAAGTPEKAKNIKVFPDLDEYVSWWPDKTELPDMSSVGKSVRSLQTDIREEKRGPDLTFDIAGLDQSMMRLMWERIKLVPTRYDSPHYHLFRRNCSHAVLLVLLAGGLDNFRCKATNPDKLTTPKRVSRILTDIAHTDSCKVIKWKADHCPSKRQAFFGTLFRMR